VLFPYLCYIIIVPRGKERERDIKKSLENLLTNFPQGDIIKMFQRERKSEKENSRQTRKESSL